MKKHVLFICLAFILTGTASAAAETISKPYTFSNNTTADAEEVNANFDQIYNQMNKLGSVVTISHNNLGIGIDTPKVPLHVFNGSAGYDSSYTFTYPELVLEDDEGAMLQLLTNNRYNCTIWFGDQDRRNSGVITYNHAEDYLGFFANTTEGMRIDSSGDVFINNNLKIANPAEGNTWVKWGSAGRVLNYNSESIILNGPGRPIEFTISDRVKMSLSMDGDLDVAGDLDFGGSLYQNGSPWIGIGTTDPKVALHVKNGSSGYDGEPGYPELVLEDDEGAMLQLLTNSAYNSTIWFADQDRRNSGVITYNHADDELRFYANTTEGMYINASGELNVKVNLEMANNGSWIRWGTAGRVLRYTGTGVVLNGPSVGIDFTISDSVKMTLDTGGNLGIGTDSPAGRLDVNGAIYQRGGVLHSDYVFDDDYVLESIEDHAAYMWKEKHLKAVPKGQKDENGLEILEVGSHRRGILEELEKAHIYIEQLNTALKAQQQEIYDLRARLEEKAGK